MGVCSGLGIEAVVTARHKMVFTDKSVSGVFLQYPDTQGSVYDLASFVNQAHVNNVRILNAHTSKNTAIQKEIPKFTDFKISFTGALTVRNLQ